MTENEIIEHFEKAIPKSNYLAECTDIQRKAALEFVVENMIELSYELVGVEKKVLHTAAKKVFDRDIMKFKPDPALKKRLEKELK